MVARSSPKPRSKQQPEGMQPPSCRPAQACTECGINATDGDYDEGDECFYCESCWARFEYLAAVVQFVRKRGTRVPVDEIGRSVPRPQARNGRPILKLVLSVPRPCRENVRLCCVFCPF